MTGTQWDRETYPKIDDADELSCRPDFLVPIYAAYLADKKDMDRHCFTYSLILAGEFYFAAAQEAEFTSKGLEAKIDIPVADALNLLSS